MLDTERNFWGSTGWEEGVGISSKANDAEKLSADFNQRKISAKSKEDFHAGNMNKLYITCTMCMMYAMIHNMFLW